MKSSGREGTDIQSIRRVILTLGIRHTLFIAEGGREEGLQLQVILRVYWNESEGIL